MENSNDVARCCYGLQKPYIFGTRALDFFTVSIFSIKETHVRISDLTNLRQEDYYLYLGPNYYNEAYGYVHNNRNNSHNKLDERKFELTTTAEINSASCLGKNGSEILF